MTDDLDPSDRQPRGPADWLTLPGRLLLVLTFIAFAGGYAWFLLRAIDNLPSGSYPVFFFIIPVLIVAALFFLAAAFVLERLGVRIYRRRSNDG